MIDKNLSSVLHDVSNVGLFLKEIFYFNLCFLTNLNVHSATLHAIFE